MPARLRSPYKAVTCTLADAYSEAVDLEAVLPSYFSLWLATTVVTGDVFVSSLFVIKSHESLQAQKDGQMMSAFEATNMASFAIVTTSVPTSAYLVYGGPT